MGSIGFFLASNNSLQVTDSLISQNGQFMAAMQPAGNFVVYKGTDPNSATVIWSSHTQQEPYFTDPVTHQQYYPTPTLTLQNDSNLIISFSAAGMQGPGFSISNTGGHPAGAYLLILQNNGSLVLYQGSNPNAPGQPLWSSPAIATVIDSYTVGQLRLQIFAATSDCAPHPCVSVGVPNGWCILGGGAFVDWEHGVCTGPGAPGNLLTAMYPSSATVWTVASKDHDLPGPAQITGYCIAAQMQDGTSIPASAYQIVSQQSGVAPHPSTEAGLPDGWVLVGGGARADYGAGAGQLLYASIPDELSHWFAASKDHVDSDPATVTAFAIGVSQSFLTGAGVVVGTPVSLTSPTPTNHPSATFVIADWHLVGGGAQVNWTGGGNLLTASFPQDRQTWIAQGKDHEVADPATITAWGIGCRALQ